MQIKTSYILLVYILSVNILFAQNPVPDTRANDRGIDGSIKQSLIKNSTYSNYPSKNIGPTIMSGRVTDIAINPIDPTEFYVSYASGGLWHTNNNGTSFDPIFDNESVMTIGAVTVDWQSEIIYVGTGEVNSSRSSYAGNGVYKSTDKGKSWTNIGLPESHHIGQIIIDQTNSSRILVAALGHLYSPNVERGFYLSEDGGNSWQQTLFVNENSGGIDIIQDPNNPLVFYGATWQRERRAWNFVESGVGSGIYKSIDGGKTWSLLTASGNGFPTGEGTGRIGLDITSLDGTTYLFAILDNYNRRPKDKEEPKGKDGLQKDDFKTMESDNLFALSDEKLGAFLEENGFPKKYNAKSVKKLIKDKTIEPIALAEYLEDANSLLFDTDVIGAEVYVSKDDGGTFNKTHEGYINGLFNSYGYYFAQVRAEPSNPNVLYIMGVPILKSEDMGISWRNINGENVHVDHHSLWINPKNPRHLINGNDGGINISYDGGDNWIKCNSPSVGQFYFINVDNAEPYNVYAGAQDNGVWVGPSNYEESVRWHQSGKYPYESIMGGDGMQIQIDNRNNNIVYTGFQFGNYFRINRANGKRSYITPKHDLGDRPYRWNWQTPILLSSHNQDIMYMGSNKILRSFDKGDNFKEISSDLTNGGIKGDVAYGTITTIDESKKTFGKLLVGTDDGNVHLTNDGGNTWSNITLGLPNDRWVTRAILSDHDDNTIYVSLNGYRWDDFGAYVYKSTDNGRSWMDISSTLPVEPVNVIKEDPTDSDLLYLGTDHGLYMSYNGGVSFESIADSMPNVAVHDVVIQEEAGHLLVGTHGRSIYKIDLAFLRQSKDLKGDFLLYDIKDVRYQSNWGSQYAIYSKVSEPNLTYTIFSNSKSIANMSITTTEDKVLYSNSIPLNRGINTFDYHLDIEASSSKTLEKYINKDKDKKERSTVKEGKNGKTYLVPGEYKLKTIVNGSTQEKTFKVK